MNEQPPDRKSTPDPLDPVAVLRELGIRNPTAATLLAANRDKGVWRVQHDDTTSALRVLRPGEHPTAEHEALMMNSARSAGIPVPELRATATWQGRPAMLMSWCHGRILKDEIRARPWSAYSLGLICGRAVAQLHQAAPPPQVDGIDWKGRFTEIDQHLRKRLDAIESTEPRLLHLDLSLTNLIVRGDRLIGMLDWTNACGGDPRADLGRTWSLLAASGGSTVAKLAKRTLMNGWQRGYAQVAGRQSDLLLFRIWAMQGVLRVSRTHAIRYQQQVSLDSWKPRLAAMRARAGLPPIPLQ